MENGLLTKHALAVAADLFDRFSTRIRAGGQDDAWNAAQCRSLRGKPSASPARSASYGLVVVVEEGMNVLARRRIPRVPGQAGRAAVQRSSGRLHSPPAEPSTAVPQKRLTEKKKGQKKEEARAGRRAREV